jgi:hypothetical protein
MKTILILAGALTLAPFALPAAHASGGPYAVDDAGIATPGMRKLESWVSFGDNGDFISVVSPGITFEALSRIEFELTIERDRRDGDWGTTAFSSPSCGGSSPSWPCRACISCFRACATGGRATGGPPWPPR